MNARHVPAVRVLRREEIGPAARTLALAFDDDPIFRYLLPRADQRAGWLRWFHTRTLTESFISRGAHVIEDGPQLGVIGLFAPGAWPPRFLSTLRAAPLPRHLPTLRLLTAGLPIEAQMRVRHPRAPHVYVYVVGVHPTRKGQGLGGALLRKAVDDADRAGVAAYLETSNPVNLDLYRRFGFEVDGEIRVGAAPTVWTMTRPAALSDQSPGSGGTP